MSRHISRIHRITQNPSDVFQNIIISIATIESDRIPFYRVASRIRLAKRRRERNVDWQLPFGRKYMCDTPNLHILAICWQFEYSPFGALFIVLSNFDDRGDAMCRLWRVIYEVVKGEPNSSSFAHKTPLAVYVITLGTPYSSWTRGVAAADLFFIFKRIEGTDGFRGRGANTIIT